MKKLISKANRPKVTVMMPVYNVARFVKASIESVLRQNFASFELVIFDDGSDDESGDIARQYQARDARVRVYGSDKNRGVAYARNQILKRARGELLAPHDGDDIMLQGRLGAQVKILERYPDVGVVFGGAIVLNGTLPNDKIFYRPYVRHKEKVAGLLRSQKMKLYPENIPHCSVMLRKAVVLDAGGYNEKLQVGEDTDLFQRLWGRAQFYFLSRFFYLLRLRSTSLRSKAKAEELSACKNRATLFHRKARRVTFCLHDWRVKFHSTCPRYLKIIKKNLSYYFKNSGIRRTNKGSCQKMVTFRIDSRSGKEAGIEHEIDGHGQYVLKEDGCWRSIDLQTRAVAVYLSKERPVSESLIYHGGFLYPLSRIMSQSGAFLTHAALLSMKNQGVLIMGQDGAGKSTLTLAFLAHGYDYFSDEHAILTCRNKQIIGKSFINRIGIPRISAKNFPRLKHLFSWDGAVKKYYLYPKRVRRWAMGKDCVVTKVLFPAFKKYGRLAVRRLDKREFFEKLLEDAYLALNSREGYEKRSAKRYLKLFFKLKESAAGYEVKYTRGDICSLPEYISNLEGVAYGKK